MASDSDERGDVKALANYARRVDKRVTRRPRFRKVPFILRLPEPLLREIDRRASYLGMTRTGLITWALQRLLKDRYGKVMVSYPEGMEKRRGEGEDGRDKNSQASSWLKCLKS